MHRLYTCCPQTYPQPCGYPVDMFERCDSATGPCCCSAAVCCCRVVGPTGIEPVCIAARDFKSLVSTYFTTFPCTVNLLWYSLKIYFGICCCVQHVEPPVIPRAAAHCCCCGLPGGTRTPDRRLRRPLRYPTVPRADVWWAPRESNSAPTDYESAALTNMS